MSFNYTLEPATEGKVILQTSAGAIDVELWPKQAPIACRNFVQLCLEGYYNNNIFHRIIKDFMLQTGDPTGSGDGGESVYGKKFKNEIHSRLRFSHRGIVAMACPEGETSSNSSQFFITTNACDWLNGRHTIFAKVTGDTIFNALKISECEVDDDDRPVDSSPRILSTQVIANPFEDIIPRERKIPEKSKTKKTKKKGTHNVSLLSFGDDDVISQPLKKSQGIRSSHELLRDDPSLAAPEDIASTLQQTSSESITLMNPSSTKTPQVHIEDTPDTTHTIRDAIRDTLTQLKREVKNIHVESTSSTENVCTTTGNVKKVSKKRLRAQREDETLKKLEKFSKALSRQNDDDDDDVDTHNDDGDASWMSSKLDFGKRPQDFDDMKRNVNQYEYTTYDPLKHTKNTSMKTYEKHRQRNVRHDDEKKNFSRKKYRR